MASAIDFRGLLLAEKKRAREAKKEDKERSGSSSSTHINVSASATPSTLTTPPVPTASPSSDTTWQMIMSNPPTFVASTHVIMPSSIKSVYYVKNYLPNTYISMLRTWLLSLPERLDDGRSEEQIAASSPCWTKLRHSRRRVALFDGRKSPLPAALDAISSALVDSGVFPSETPPNHVLVNDYNAGEGIMPHTDGPSYLDRTATISIGGDVILKFRKRLKAHEIGEIPGIDCMKQGLDLLLSGLGSLVVFTGDAYSNHLHSIDEVDSEVTTQICRNAKAGITVKRAHRISLTFRYKYQGNYM